MAQANRPSQRFYDLDVLRAVTMFLGIVEHVCLFVLPAAQPLWPIYDAAAKGDPTYHYVLEVLHGFRTPVFFLISGFFSALLWQRRGLYAFSIHRLKRIGIPLAAGCLTIVPLSIWMLAAGGGYQDPYDFPLWTLPLVWIFSLTHLWFLWYLLLMVGAFALAVRLGLQFRHRMVWWLAIPVSLGISLLMVDPIYGSDTATGVVPNPTVIAYNACFFVFGVFFYQRGFTVRRWWTVALLPAGALFYAGFHLLGQYLAPFEGVVSIGSAASDFEGAVPDAFMFKNPLTLASTLIETLSTWLMCFGLMGLFRWVAARASAATLYLSDSSYWCFLAHLPLVIAAQMLIVDWPIHYHLKYLLVCAGVSLVLLATYQFGVRYTFIGRTLNGPRSRRQPAPPSQPQQAGSG